MLNKLPTGWQQCCFEDVLDYEQPTKYIVKNTNYEDKGVAVLTAGKSFILGYTKETTGIFYGDKEPVIIFDDFTTSSKLVKFPFKVKSSAMKILHARDNINIDFIYYLMQTISYRNETHKRYWISEYAKQKLNLPPLEEQGRIVEKIEELFSDIDNGIKDLKTAQAQIKQYRQSVLKSAFEGKLYKTSEWKEVDIKKIISREKNALKAGPFGSALKKEIYVANGYKIYGQEQVISQNPFLGNYYINEEKYQQLISCSVKPLDILISLVGTIGKVLILPKGIEKGIINPRLIKVTLDVDQYLPAFFKLYFESQYLRSLFKTKAHGATMDVLNLSILKEIPFPLPTIPEQQQIVAEIEKRFAVADEMEKAVNDSLLQAEKLKQSILKQAFAGKLVPQNPNDEPAAVLLERIKAAKENSTKGKK